MNVAATVRFEKLVKEALGHMTFGEYLLNNHSRDGSRLFAARLVEIQRSVLRLVDRNVQIDRVGVVRITIKSLEGLVADMERDGGYNRLFMDEISASRVCLVNTLCLFPEYGVTRRTS